MFFCWCLRHVFLLHCAVLNQEFVEVLFFFLCCLCQGKTDTGVCSQHWACRDSDPDIRTMVPSVAPKALEFCIPWGGKFSFLPRVCPLKMHRVLWRIQRYMQNIKGAPQAQCAHSATIWASGRTRDPYFEILGAPRGIMVTRSGGFEF